MKAYALPNVFQYNFSLFYRSRKCQVESAVYNCNKCLKRRQGYAVTEYGSLSSFALIKHDTKAIAINKLRKWNFRFFTKYLVISQQKGQIY